MSVMQFEELINDGTLNGRDYGVIGCVYCIEELINNNTFYVGLVWPFGLHGFLENWM